MTRWGVGGDEGFLFGLVCLWDYLNPANAEYAIDELGVFISG